MTPRNNLAYRRNAEPDGQLRPDFEKKGPLCERYRSEGKWAICGSNDVPQRQQHMEETERVLLDKGKADPEAACVIACADKASLNHINRTAGTSGGNEVISHSMDIICQTMITAFPNAGNPYLSRRNIGSDENDSIASASFASLSQVTPAIFIELLREESRRADMQLQDKLFRINKLRLTSDGWKPAEVLLSLKQYSAALKNAGLVSACHIQLSDVIRLCEQSQGFILRAIAALESAETDYIARLPSDFRPKFESPPQVSPFIGQIPVTGPIQNAVAFEIKFSHIKRENQLAPLMVIDEAKKGRAGILSNRFGLSYINTYMGKDVADYLLGAVAHALHDIVKSSLYEIKRTSSNLIYVVLDSNNPGLVTWTVNQAISKALNSLYGNSPEGKVPFIPHTIGLDASGAHSNDLRAMLALEGMGMGHLKSETLTYTDLLVAAVNVFRDDLIRESLSRLDDPGRHAGAKVLNIIRSACSTFSGVRDTEDLIYTLRNSNDPNADLKEVSIWSFAKNHGKQLRNSIIDSISGL